jgi:hypothetical protein
MHDDMENYKKHWEFMRQKDKEYKEMVAADRKHRYEEYCRENNITPTPSKPEQPKHFDHPDTMDNGPATVLYILAMIVGSLFKDRILVYMFATIFWWCHINRHNLRNYRK